MCRSCEGREGVDLARRVLYGQEGNPPKGEINNDGIVLALAPATRSARGIREALISYHSFFLKTITQSNVWFDTSLPPPQQGGPSMLIFGSLSSYIPSHSSEGTKERTESEQGATGILLFRPFILFRLPVLE